eukprot:13982109-Heterocapsa_arctica.AAC.1
MPTRVRITHLYAIQAVCAVVLAQVADSALANGLLQSRVASRPKPSSDTRAEARKGIYRALWEHNCSPQRGTTSIERCQ